MNRPAQLSLTLLDGASSRASSTRAEAPPRSARTLPRSSSSAFERRTKDEPEARALSSALAAALEHPIRLVLTDNRRTMVSTAGGRPATVRVHRIFLGAPRPVVDALARYLANGDGAASRLLGAYADAHRALLRPRRVLGVAAGAHHDLSAILRDVDAAHFGGGAARGVRIVWAPRTERRLGRSIRLGAYDRDARVVRIHPALDADWVPDFFLRYVVFHELLHHVEPAGVASGRTVQHTPRFRARERAHPDHARAVAWERAHVARLAGVGD